MFTVTIAVGVIWSYSMTFSGVSNVLLVAQWVYYILAAHIVIFIAATVSFAK
jgi:hypothetical protein